MAMEQQVFNNINYRFFIRGTRPTKPYTLYIRIRSAGKTILASCGVKVYKDQWCQRKQRAYISPQLSEIDNYNNDIVNRTIEEHIEKLENSLKKSCLLLNKSISLRCRLEDSISCNSQATHINMGKKLTSKQPKREIDIFKFLIDAAINDKDAPRTDTRKNYGRGIARFKEFANWRAEHGHTPITSYNDVTCQLMEEFCEYLCKVAKSPKGEKLTITTINSLMKYFISPFHKYAHKSGTISKEQSSMVNAPYLKNKSNVVHIALRDDEITKLLQHKCDNPKDEEIKDMFLMLCLTGQRVGDRDKISEGCDTSNGFDAISFVQNKGQVVLDAPIVFEAAEQILNKYARRLPSISEKQINQNIGRIAAAAGVGCDGLVKSTQHYGGEATVRTTTKRRCDCIKSHTGRRTFCTLLALRGWSFEKIKSFSGHRKADTIERYYSKMTATEIHAYEIMKREHPEVILRFTNGFASDEPQPSFPQLQINTEKPLLIESSVVSDIDEARKVLCFLGANADDYIDCNDIHALLRMIGHYESTVIGGIPSTDDIDKIKEVFNEQAPMSERRLHLHNLLRMACH